MIDAKITKLTGLYYSLIANDHHKDRDCHFYINKYWSYGDEPCYMVEHYGYCNNEFSISFKTSQEAHKFLVKKLEEYIDYEKFLCNCY